MMFYYAGVLSSGVYCASNVFFALFSLLLNLTLQSVDFCFCWVWCHNFIAFGYYTFPLRFTILNRLGFLY